MVFSGLIRRIGKLAAGFATASRRHDPFSMDSFPAAEPMRRRVEAKFTPLVQLLNDTIKPDDEGRRYHLITHASLLLGDDPAVYVTIGRFNEKELQAAQYFSSEEGGWHAKAPNGCTFPEINARGYDFNVPVLPDSDRMMFIGYAPMAPDARRFTQGSNNHICTRFTRTNLDRVYQGMMHDLDLAEASRFVFVDWKDLKEAAEQRMATAPASQPAAKPARFNKG